MLNIINNINFLIKNNNKNINFIDIKNIVIVTCLNNYLFNYDKILTLKNLNKINFKKLKFNLLRYAINILPENFFFLLILKNFKKKKANKLLFRRLGTAMPKIVWLSLKSFEPLLILNSLLFTLNKVHFLVHRKIIKRLTTALLIILGHYRLLLGFEFSVVGKVSVGGNARTRTFNTIFGMRSRSKLWVMGKKVNDIVYSVTGCLGISLFFSF